LRALRAILSNGTACGAYVVREKNPTASKNKEYYEKAAGNMPAAFVSGGELKL